MLAARRLRSPGIHLGLSAVGVGSRSIGRLAERDCQGVRRVRTQWKTVGFTYEMLPRACEGSLGVPAWCFVVCGVPGCVSLHSWCADREEEQLSQIKFM